MNCALTTPPLPKVPRPDLVDRYCGRPLAQVGDSIEIAELHWDLLQYLECLALAHRRLSKSRSDTRAINYQKHGLPRCVSGCCTQDQSNVSSAIGTPFTWEVGEGALRGPGSYGVVWCPGWWLYKLVTECWVHRIVGRRC